MKNLENELVQIISSVTEAKDFIVSELPEVVQQLLTYKIYEYSIELAQCTFFVLLAIIILITCIKNNKEWSDGKQFGMWGAFIISFVCGIVGFISGVASIKALVQIYMAPKLFLIEYTMGLIK